MQENPENLGIDWDGPVTENEPEIVEVPATNCPLNDVQVDQVINQMPQELTFNNAFDTYEVILNQTVALINTQTAC